MEARQKIGKQRGTPVSFPRSSDKAQSGYGKLVPLPLLRQLNSAIGAVRLGTPSNSLTKILDKAAPPEPKMSSVHLKLPAHLPTSNTAQ